MELPDVMFRHAKAVAAARGVTLRRFFTEAIEAQLRRYSTDDRTGSSPPPWMAGFGALSDLSDENRRVLDAMEEEFEGLAPEGLEWPSTPTRCRHGRRDMRRTRRHYSRPTDWLFPALFSVSVTLASANRVTVTSIRIGWLVTC